MSGARKGEIAVVSGDDKTSKVHAKLADCARAQRFMGSVSVFIYVYQ
jgi:hypothetical protein